MSGEPGQGNKKEKGHKHEKVRAAERHSCSSTAQLEGPKKWGKVRPTIGKLSQHLLYDGRPFTFTPESTGQKAKEKKEVPTHHKGDLKKTFL